METKLYLQVLVSFDLIHCLFGSFFFDLWVFLIVFYCFGFFFFCLLAPSMECFKREKRVCFILVSIILTCVAQFLFCFSPLLFQLPSFFFKLLFKFSCLRFPAITFPHQLLIEEKWLNYRLFTLWAIPSPGASPAGGLDWRQPAILALCSWPASLLWHWVWSLHLRWGRTCCSVAFYLSLSNRKQRAWVHFQPYQHLLILVNTLNKMRLSTVP